MKQIIQDLKSGETILENIPVPLVKPGYVLIKTHRSLVSLGTERMLVEFGKANWIDKARQQPEKVKQVIDKIKSDGLRPTMEAVFRKLGEPLPLGYCNAGEVIDVGKGVHEFKVGDRVVSNGHHAEVVCIPKQLVAKIPDGVSYEAASFTVIGAIALQGIRLLNPTFGETIVVTGLGLIGLLATQLLKANGCRVIGLDFDENKVKLAKRWGITAIQVKTGTDVVETVVGLTQQIGADGILITASTKSNQVISEAAQMSRKRGRIVLVGVIGLNIMRSDFYEKELSFQVSCSYGPGRYDEEYELKGRDYPLPYVRWTEQRNFHAILQALASQQLDVTALITERVKLEEYHKIYDNLSGNASIASLLEYSGQIDPAASVVNTDVAKQFVTGQPVIGIIGAGNFTKAMILPVLNKLGAQVKYVASSGGLSGTTAAKKFNIPYSTTQYEDILNDKEVDAVIITTKHHAHAKQVMESIKAGKHVFVEKPLALGLEELETLIEVYQQHPCSISVGFNRRFSPFITEAKEKLGDTGQVPIQVIATMNAGAIPSTHWTQDLEVGGGRIIGEACHLIDLITFLTEGKVSNLVMNGMGQNPELNTDNASILLKYDNGSSGVINYFANGHKSYSKERIEIYAQGKTIIVDNFRKSRYYGFKRRGRSGTQDKGHAHQFAFFLKNLETGQPTIPFDQIVNTTKASIAALTSLRERRWVAIH